MKQGRSRELWLAFSTLLLAANAHAQCSIAVQPAEGLSGVDGIVYAATTWDPDGAGPLGPRIVYGGAFTGAANIPASRIAAFDPATGAWSNFGAGCNGAVTSLLALPNGELLAGGEFTMAGGVPAAHIAKWNGANWSALGGGFSYPAQPFLLWGVNAMLRLPSGDVVACGRFTHAEGAPAAGIARWDGTHWSPLGGGLISTQSATWGGALALLPNGELVVGGVFTHAGGVPATNLARWNGAAWLPLPGVALLAGVDQIRSLLVLPNGDLLVGGYFPNIGGTGSANVARWDGTAWYGVGSGLSDSVGALARLSNGDLVAGLNFSSLGGPFNVARFAGTAWQPLGSGAALHRPVYALVAASNDDVYVGGNFVGGSNTLDVRCVARWQANTSSWGALAIGGPNDAILALARMPNGDLVVGGRFTQIGGVPMSRVSRRDAGGWHALGGGTDGAVQAVVVLGNGDLVAAGAFAAPAPNIARWNGTSWLPLGSGVNGAVYTMLERSNGNVIAAGQFTNAGGLSTSNIAEWNGNGWQALGGGLPTSGGAVYAMTWLANGDLLAGGSFPAGGASVPCVFRWNGTAWSTFAVASANYPPSISALATAANGDVIAAGAFSSIGGFPAAGVARWNGASWSPLGPTINNIYALLPLPNGDVLAGGYGGVLGRFHAGSWTAVPSGPNAIVHSLVWSASDTVAIGGAFTNVGGWPSVSLATLTTSCPASTTVLTTPCLGPAGPMQLSVAPGPWLGAVMTSTASGYTQYHIAIAVFGFGNPSLPLTLVDPLALPGCSLLADADLLVPVPTTSTGVGTLAITLPDLPFLAGLPVFHQHVQLSTDAVGAPTSMSSSNGLRLVLGAF